jgi:hypothetical protein
VHHVTLPVLSGLWICGRYIGLSASTRRARCSACRIARSSKPIETQLCTSRAIPSRANSIYIRSEVCRQASHLNRSHDQPPSPDFRHCSECREAFHDRISLHRCFPCRSRGLNFVQLPTELSQFASAVFNQPFV